MLLLWFPWASFSLYFLVNQKLQPPSLGSFSSSNWSSLPFFNISSSKKMILFPTSLYIPFLCSSRQSLLVRPSFSFPPPLYFISFLLAILVSLFLRFWFLPLLSPFSPFIVPSLSFLPFYCSFSPLSPFFSFALPQRYSRWLYIIIIIYPTNSIIDEIANWMENRKDSNLFIREWIRRRGDKFIY